MLNRKVIIQLNRLIILLAKISLGVRPGTLQDFCIESQRMVPTPLHVSLDNLNQLKIDSKF